MVENAAGSNSYAVGQADTRPWGDWRVTDCGPGFVVKRIRVAPGQRLSLQRHRYRAEQWVVVTGTARATRNAEEFDLAAGETTHIAVGDIHRIANPGPTVMEFVEVQTGPVLSEDDIERLEDMYGRVP